MDDTENKEQEPETDSPASDPNATSSDSSDELGSAEIDPPIIVQGGGSGNP
jgi:hypothetical protein